MTSNDADIKNPLSAEIDEISELTPHNEGLYEAGKALLVESINVGREFCKFMITSSMSAIPIYLALLKFILPKDYVLKALSEAIIFLPCIFFFIAAIIFVVGYFPQTGQLSLDIPAEIEKERNDTIKRRRNSSIFGFALFCAGLVSAVIIVIDKMYATNT